MNGDTIPIPRLMAKKHAEKAAETAEGGATEAVEQLLHAMEGMQAQLQTLTDLVISQDKRIKMLEKAAQGRIIRG